MRILVCLDGTNIEQLITALKTLVKVEQRDIALLNVTDSGPHKEIDRKRDSLLRGRRSTDPLDERMRMAEIVAAQDILQEGSRYIPDAELIHHDGRPEREIVQFAFDWNADLILICSRSPRVDRPEVGPKSVGHVARFVLDHAPCPVLLVRPRLTTFQLP